jgi:hypothetical protein
MSWRRLLSVGVVVHLGILTTNGFGATFCVSTPSTLSAALTTAASNGQTDSIRLVSGTYSGNFIYASVEPLGLTIEGGYAAGCGARTVDAANTILDGGATATVLVLTTDQAVSFAIDGLTLRNGFANSARRNGGGLLVSTAAGTVLVTRSAFLSNRALGAPAGSFPSNSGGGLFVGQANSVAVRNSRFDGNTADLGGLGGGAFAYNAGSIIEFVEFSDNRFHNNSAGVVGGGVAIDVQRALFQRNEVDGNSAGNGGGASLEARQLEVLDNDFHDNAATGGLFLGVGGAAHVGHSGLTGSVALLRNRFTANTATNRGGAVNMLAGTAVIARNRFLANASAGIGGIDGDDGGGGIFVTYTWTVTWTNNLFVANSAKWGGGGIDARGSSTPTGPPSLMVFSNNTLANNSATNDDGGGLRLALHTEVNEAQIHNNILVGNTASTGGADLSIHNDGDGDFLRSPVQLRNNDFDHTAAGFLATIPFPMDPSNIDDVDPLFVNPAAGDYHLQPSSPVANVGDNGALGMQATDLEGLPRIMGGTVDLGAFEVLGAVTPLPGRMVTGSFDSDARADLVVDFGAVYGLWVLWNGVSWLPLAQGASVGSMAVGKLDGNQIDDLIVDFGPSRGVWVLWNNAHWGSFHGGLTKSIALGNLMTLEAPAHEEAVIDFGIGYGLFLAYGPAESPIWYPLHGRSSDSAVMADLDNSGADELLLDFGDAYGIWQWRASEFGAPPGSWTLVHGLSPESMLAIDLDGNGQDDFVADFGSQYGVWTRLNNSTWSLIHGLSPKSMVAGNLDGNQVDDLLIDFGSNYGIWARMNNTTWTQLHGYSAASMVVADLDANGQDDLVVNFGVGLGIWSWRNNSAWVRLH